MRKLTLLALLLASISAAARADEGGDQAASFAKLYTTLCMKHLTDLEALRVNLRPMPKLPPEKAALFLSGHAGDAWPVPDKHGLFVLALPASKNFCAVHARRADTAAAEKAFIAIVASAPPPLVARKTADQHAGSGANGITHTIAYEWSVPNAKRKMLFTLTTASSPTAQLQVLGSAAIVGE